MNLSLGKTNLRQICGMLKLIYRDPGINRKKLGELLNVDRAMITHIYNYLVENEWIIEQDSPLKRLPLVLNKDRIFAAGVEIQPEYQIVVIANIRGDIVFEKCLYENLENIKDFDSFFSKVILKEIETSGIKVAAISLAVPGIINSVENKIIRSVPLGIKENIQVPFEVTFESSEDIIPVFIDNDVRCWGWGKVAFLQESKPFFVISQHFIDDKNNPDEISRISGGGAFFSDFKPNVGGHGCAGELPFIFRLDEFKTNHVCEDDRRNMKQNPEVMKKFLRNCALTVSYLSNVFDVSRIYIEGFENMDTRYLLEKIEKYLEEYRFYPDIQNTEIVLEKPDRNRTAHGACGFAFEKLIVFPCETEISESRLFQKKS